MEPEHTNAADARSEAASANIARRMRALAARPDAVTVRELIDRYLARYSGADSTRAQRLHAWAEMIGACTLEAVDQDLLFAARAELQAQPAAAYKGRDLKGLPIFRCKRGGKPRSEATLNRYMVAISAVFTWAIEQRLTPKGWSNPCHGIRRFRENNERVRYLDDAERERLLLACKASRYPRLHALVLMAMLTGARKGELMSLTWAQVDLEAGLATLSRTKNGDRRTLVLLPQLVQLLQPLRGDAQRLVFGSVSSRYQRAASIETAWAKALERAQIRDFRFHDLRHCCASYMAQAGVPLNVVAEVLGHRKLDMTKRYAHLTTHTKAAAMRLSLGAIGAPAAPAGQHATAAQEAQP